MADVHSSEVRSYNMSRIRSKNTRPEILVRKALFAKGFRYRLHDKKLPGKPDIVFKKYRTVIFVHGCFWHGHANCKYFVLPKTRSAWWRNKINKNKALDRIHELQLQNMGWRVLTVFECDLKKEVFSSTVSSLARAIRNKK